MKLCPNCKGELDDNARFCLCCMTSLDEKEQIPPPAPQVRRWPLVLLCVLVLGIIGAVICIPPKRDIPQTTQQPTQTVHPEDPALPTHTVDGVRYTFRPATKEDHPSQLPLGNYYVLTFVEGTPTDGIYRVPAFVGGDTNALVTAIADGAFAGTDAKAIDLGYNVRFVWGNAFENCALTDLYIHTDVLIDRATFSGCNEDLTIHSPDYVENTKGALWCDLAAEYGFRWQPEII